MSSILPSGQAEASAGTHLQRIKGTVGFASDVGAPKHEVTTSADIADGADAYASCSSLAALSFPSGATAMLGGSTDLKAPVDGGPAILGNGVVQYRSDMPFAIATKYGTVQIKRGTGYVLAGRKGVEIISIDAGAADVVFATASGSFAVPGGKTLAQPITEGKPGVAMLLPNAQVNNPATYQFAQGRNPLGTDAVTKFDPTGSPTTDCKFAAAAATGEVAAIIAALLGAGAITAVAMKSGSDGNISPSTPTPFPTGPSTATASPTATPTRSPEPSVTPTPVPSATATSGGPSASPAPTASGAPTASAGPTTAPTIAPTASAGPTASAAPTASAGPTASSGPTTAPSASAAPTPAGTFGPIVLTPPNVLLAPAIGASTSATIAVTQSGYTGTYKAAVTACTGIGKHPTATVVATGAGTANVVLSATGTLNLNLGCTVKVTGGGGKTGTAPVTIELTGGATPTPAPSSNPSAAPTLGPVVLNPSPVLLSPGLGSSAVATISATQSGYTGNYTAALAGCTGIGAKPKLAIASTGPGTANVTLTSTGTLNLNLACTLKVTGGRNKSATDLVTLSLSILASPTPAPSPSAGALGPVVLNPASVLLNPGLGSSASATIAASQAGYTGSYKAVVSGCTGIGTKPGVSVMATGPGTANVTLTSTGTLNLNLGCTVKVTGGRNKSASDPVTISLSILASPTPAPSPSAGALGPVVLNPASVLLNPGLGSSATATIAASQAGYTGSYKAVVSGCTGIGTKPGVSVMATGPGTANVTLTSTGTLNLNLGCTVKVTGGRNKSASDPVTISLSILSTPTPAPSASASAAPTHGPLVLNPAAVLLNPGVGSPATTTVAASESGFTGTYTASVGGCVGVGTPPTATVVSTGPGTANVSVTATGTLNLNLGCTLTVKGGGMTATAPITVTVSVLSTPTPSPVPTASGTIGALTVSPASILLNPGIGSAATAHIAVTQPNYPGTFTAAVTGCSGVGSPPVAAVTSTGVGTATVTVTATGVLNANLGCNVVVTGGNGATASVPVTITLAVVAPSPTPTPPATGFGPITANPSSVLLLPGVGASATTNVIVSQTNYTGSFGATLSCPVALNGQPNVSVSSNGTAGQAVVTVTVPAPLAAAVACTLTVTGGGGAKVNVPVTVGAAIGGSPTPTPAPGATTGPLTANPSSVLLNPGVTTSATQIIALSDPGYTGAYTAGIACATSGLSPILAGVFQNPSVTVSGSTLTVTSPGQALGISLGCNVTVSTTVPQTLTVPITISVSALSTLGRKRSQATATSSTATMLFTPATVALQPRGDRASGSFDVSGIAGPYKATANCPAGTVLRTSALGNRIELDQISADAQATCMVTVTGAGGVSSQVPVRTYALAGTGIGRVVLPGTRHPIVSRPNLALHVGESQTISVSGPGPIEVSGCSTIATVRLNGDTLVATGRAAGSCSLTLRGPGGLTTGVGLTVAPSGSAVSPGRANRIIP